MEGDSCLGLFDDLRASKQLTAEGLDGAAPDGHCEWQQVSAFVSDPVLNEESLIRVVVDDTHVKVDAETNALRLKSTFLEDCNVHGSSTLRLGRATRAEIQETIDLLVSGRRKLNGEPKAVIGYVLIPTATVRDTNFEALIDSNSGERFDKAKHKADESEKIVFRAHATYATGEATRPNHADIFATNTRFSTKSGRQRHATNLGEEVAPAFVKIQDVEDLLALGVDTVQTQFPD